MEGSVASQLGQRLKAYRELAGLSQNELSKRSGVPRPTITNVESGAQDGLTLENARKLARALGITIDALAGKEEKEAAPTTQALVPA
jgi:transcriptional regulator with XRE-family HTH domain